MPSFNITADDTFTLGGRIFNDFADGDNVTIIPKDDKVDAKSGKNLNTIFAQKPQGFNGDVTLRLMRGSPDDQFLQGQLAAQDQDFAATVLMDGEFTKRLGDGKGNVKRDVVRMSGVIIKRNPDSKENAEGNTEQAIAIWNLFAAKITRSTQ